MAVAPVLEREIISEKERVYTDNYCDNYMTEDERHNSQISTNYLKLINPESTLRDFAKVQTPVQQKEEVNFAAYAEAPEADQMYLVENARADADIFRAESYINRKAPEVMQTSAEEEEENEDLRPTQTTIQYKTTGVHKTSEEGKIATKTRAQRTVLSKKDKIIIAVALAVIVALFALIIVNSVVISGLNSEVSALQTALTAAEQSYNNSLAAKNAYLDGNNLYQIVSEFAAQNGMSLR